MNLCWIPKSSSQVQKVQTTPVKILRKYLGEYCCSESTPQSSNNTLWIYAEFRSYHQKYISSRRHLSRRSSENIWGSIGVQKLLLNPPSNISWIHGEFQSYHQKYERTRRLLSRRPPEARRVSNGTSSGTSHPPDSLPSPTTNPITITRWLFVFRVARRNCHLPWINQYFPGPCEVRCGVTHTTQ